MAENLQKSEFKDGEFAPWSRGAAFNAQWTYSYVNNAPYYAKVRGTFKQFMQRFVQNWLWWYDGWVPYFHNAERGIMNTNLAKALVDRTAKKVSGSRTMFKNAFDEDRRIPSTEVNPSLKTISKWAAETNWTRTKLKAITFALAAGTSLVKIDKAADGKYITDAIRLDRFLPVLSADGKVQEVIIFLLLNIDIVSNEKKAHPTYTLEEHRYFGKYVKADGTVIERAPLVEYQVHNYQNTVQNGTAVESEYSGRVNWNDIPKDIRAIIKNRYGVRVDEPILLPFVDSLGCEIVKATECIGNIPDLPLGESLLANIIPMLQEYDYYHSAFCTDMYLGRGKVLVPLALQSPMSPYYAGGAYEGLDTTMYTKLPATNPDEQSPLPVQFELRAEDWRRIRDTIIENIAVNTGLSSTTIASFLNDNSAKTAREISTEENETAGFVDSMRGIIEVPLNRILDMVAKQLGCEDKVVIRWSNASLQNKYTTAETLALARQAGFISLRKAVQEFNSDDDDVQVQEEYERILKEEPSVPSESDSQDFFGEGLNDDNKTTQSAGESDNGRFE